MGARRKNVLARTYSARVHSLQAQHCVMESRLTINQPASLGVKANVNTSVRISVQVSVQ